MDETQIETAKTSDELLFFPSHRRRHLKSETYHTLVRIFSQCYDQSGFSPVDQNFDREINTENGANELGQSIEKRFLGNDATEAKSLAFEKETEVNLNANDSGSQDRSISEQVAINQIEQLMGNEENEDLSIEKDVIGFQNQRIGPEQMLMDELEDIVKGHGDIVHGHNLNPPQTSLVENRSDVKKVELWDSREEHVDFQKMGLKESLSVNQELPCLDAIGIGESTSLRENDEDKRSLLNTKVMELTSIFIGDSNTPSIPINEFGELEKGKSHAQKAFGDPNLSLDEKTVAETLDFCDNNQYQRSPKPDSFKVDNEMLVKDKESEKPVCDGGMVCSSNHMTEDVEMEEGEISGDDVSMDTLLQDAVSLEDKRVMKEPLARCIDDEREFSHDEPNESDFQSPFFAHYTADKKTNGAVGLRESDKNKTVYKPDIHKETSGAEKVEFMLQDMKIEKNHTDGNRDLVLHGQILGDDATRHNNIFTEKGEAKVHLKKKRGPATKEKKEKKKRRERKKRAEKNRQLGVKRLKLPPMSKPKTITYCRHYLNGRCYEGANCKFSHDTIPLTKSKPCCHFARRSCMKGDDCPFDHQLSKYPCSNFVSKGFCSRADDCMFSHEIVPKEEATTASMAMETETILKSLTRNSTSKKQQNNDGASQQTSSLLSGFKWIHSRNNPEKNVQVAIPKQSEVVPKGTSFPSIVNSPLGGSIKLKQQILSLNNENHSGQCGSGVVQNSKETLNRTPVTTPKGINFLAFGGVQQDDLISRKLASTSASGDNHVKLSPLDNSNTHQTSSASYSNPLVKGIHPVVVPKGIRFLSFMKTSMDDSGRNGNVKLPSSLDNGNDSCVKEKQNALDEPQRSRTTSLTLPSSPISLLQSSNNPASRIYKDTPHSAQKALLSTLAFASKCESRMKLNQSNCNPAVATKTDKEAKNKGVIGLGSQQCLAKASNILEILSGIGSKSGQ